MPLSAFEKRDLSNSHEDVDWALSEVGKKSFADTSQEPSSEENEAVQFQSS